MTAFTDEWISHKLYNMKCTKKQKKDHIKHKTKMKNEYKTSFEHKKKLFVYIRQRDLFRLYRW